MPDSTELGPVDYVVYEFPDSTTSFGNAMTIELAGLVRDGTIRILDLLVFSRRDTGEIDVVEVEELVDSGLTVLDGTTAELLAWEDVENLASSISPGRSAAVIVWEYLSTASFTRAARASGAQLVARGRIPGRAIVSALASE
ncbi:DUF6325 family protein [Gordonia sp. ABSL49_1]|uniref:DUF6325 family protein n=1 Tax=unclassified Gordonia (in: high G+C Gram-positive bacteria) TaxID=2657482 RepID=UPI001F0CEFB5|nr:DUF6325 family protein [Gordonia sp. ABSL49_1]MCH5641767.1 DUF6325 family protein [Gordonia sp. ABSL49_1]